MHVDCRACVQCLGAERYVKLWVTLLLLFARSFDALLLSFILLTGSKHKAGRQKSEKAMLFVLCAGKGGEGGFDDSGSAHPSMSSFIMTSFPLSIANNNGSR